MEYGKDFQEDDVKIALKNLSIYCKDESKINDAYDFLNFYTQTISVLKVYAREVQNEYIIQKIFTMPVFDKDELANWVKMKNKLLGVKTPGLYTLFFRIFGSKKNVANFPDVKLKLGKVSAICDHMIFSIENPNYF